jgi:hypothetical protein
MPTKRTRSPEQLPSSGIGIEQSQLPELVIPVIDQGGHGGIGHDDLNDPEQPLVLNVYWPLAVVGQRVWLTVTDWVACRF